MCCYHTSVSLILVPFSSRYRPAQSTFCRSNISRNDFRRVRAAQPRSGDLHAHTCTHARTDGRTHACTHARMQRSRVICDANGSCRGFVFAGRTTVPKAASRQDGAARSGIWGRAEYQLSLNKNASAAEAGSLFSVKGFMNPEECQQLIDVYQSIADAHSDDNLTAPAVIEHVDKIEEKLAREFGLDPAHAYHTQLIRYQPGEAYDRHTDCHARPCAVTVIILYCLETFKNNLKVLARLYFLLDPYGCIAIVGC